MRRTGRQWLGADHVDEVVDVVVKEVEVGYVYVVAVVVGYDQLHQRLVNLNKQSIGTLQHVGPG